MANWKYNRIQTWLLSLKRFSLHNIKAVILLIYSTFAFLVFSTVVVLVATVYGHCFSGRSAFQHDQCRDRRQQRQIADWKIVICMYLRHSGGATEKRWHFHAVMCLSYDFVDQNAAADLELPKQLSWSAGIFTCMHETQLSITFGRCCSFAFVNRCKKNLLRDKGHARSRMKSVSVDIVEFCQFLPLLPYRRAHNTIDQTS